MKSAKKIRLEVSVEDERILDGQSRICNWLYNRLLEQANTLRETYRAKQDAQTGLTLYSKRGLRDLVPQMKENHPFLKAVYSSPLKNSALRLSRVIQDYQKSRKGQRQGAPTGWPKYRAWKLRWFSLEYDEPWKGYRVEGRTLRVQLGMNEHGLRLSVSARLTEPLPERLHDAVKTLRIVKEAGVFYAVFTREASEPALRESERARVVALDPNHKNLAYGVDSDGQAFEIANLPGLKALDARIDALKARRDHCARRSRKVTRADGTECYLPSRRWEFFNRKLEQAYAKRREQTKTYVHTVANRLCKLYDVIGIGDYAPRGGGISTAMRRAMNNRSLIGRFKLALGWTARKSGKRFCEYSETGTTRTCCVCGYVVEGGIAPEVREWTCPHCATRHLRDENAARNGLRQVLAQNTGGDASASAMPRSGHTPITVTARWAWRVASSGVLVTPRGRNGSGAVSERRQAIKPGMQLPIPDPA